MNLWQGSLSGSLCIIGLVAAGLWHSNRYEMRDAPGSNLGSAGAISAGVPRFVVNRVDWSADGRLLLSLSREAGDCQGKLVLHDTTEKTTGMPIAIMGEYISTVALTPDGRHALVGSSAGHLWWTGWETIDAPSPLAVLTGEDTFTSTAITDSGRQVAAGTNRGEIYLCDPERQTSFTLTAFRSSAVSDLHFTHDGTRLISAQHDGTIRVWEAATGELLREFTGHGIPATGAAFLPDGERVISAGLDDTVRIWDIAGGRELWRGEFELGGIRALAVSADGRTAAWGGRNRRIVVWDLERSQKRFDIATPASVVFHLGISHDGSLLAVGGTESVIRLYDMQTGIEQQGIELDLAQIEVGR
jgi:WD40 repeat protein